MKLKHEIKVGIFLLISTAILIFAIVWLNKFEFGTHLKIYAKFKDVGTLNKGSTVLYRGVYCGKVEDITLSNDSNFAIVTLDVTNKKINIPKGSTASVVDKGFTGTKVLTINTPEKLESNQLLKTGDTIEGKQSFTIEEFQKLLTRKSEDGTVESIIDNTNNLLINTNKLTIKLDNLLVKIEEFNKGKNKNKINNLISSITMLSQNINTTSTMINSLMTNKKLGKDVVKTITTTYKAMDAIDKVADKTSGLIDKSENTVDKINTTATTINQIVEKDEMGEKITQSITDLSSILNTIKDITEDKEASSNIKNLLRKSYTSLENINCLSVELSNTLSKRFLIPRMILGKPGKSMQRCTIPETINQKN